MDYNIHKICRVCLEEGALTSIYSTEFAMMPSTMMMMCAKMKVYKSDGLPAVICNNCIYRLGVAYHFKQECENTDIRLRQYLGIENRTYSCDAETNTDIRKCAKPSCYKESSKNFDPDNQGNIKKSNRRARYERKPPQDHKKRGPKPVPKLPQSCYDCNKTFKCSAQLQMHIRTHTGEKPFVCNYCPRRFAQKYNLRIHERIHTGDRPFQCEICSKQFSALGNFQAHRKIHTGVRNQSCPVCQKSFYTVGDLSKHMIIHTGMKNYHCDLCGKTFSRQRDMQSHKRKVHVLQEIAITEDDDAEQVSANVSSNFNCPHCDKEFTSANCFGTHVRSHSNNNLLAVPIVGEIHPHDNHYMHIPHEALHSLLPPLSSSTTLESQTITSSNFTHSVTSTTSGINHKPSALSMAMAHVTMAHILPSHAPPPPSLQPTPTAQNTLSIMQVTQRISPY